MLRSVERPVINETRGLTPIYVMRSKRAGLFKIGIGDVRARLNGHRTAQPDMELVAAVQHASAEAIEGQLLAHFKDARIGTSENLEATPEVEEWVEKFQASPGVARSIAEIPHSFSMPHLWPWSVPSPLMTMDGQTSLEIVTPYVAPDGSGDGQTSAVSEDWYTPPRYIEAVREMFGGTIDLDPASCPEANRIVRASNIFTAEVDGLRHSWHGNVYINPPWGRQGTAKKAFVRRALLAYETGEITQAILALNSNASTSAWFAPLFAHPICFPNHRVPHYGPGGAGGNPNSGTVFVYLGSNVALFAAIFSEFGAVLPPAFAPARSSDHLAADYEDEAV